MNSHSECYSSTYRPATHSYLAIAQNYFYATTTVNSRASVSLQPQGFLSVEVSF